MMENKDWRGGIGIEYPRIPVVLKCFLVLKNARQFLVWKGFWRLNGDSIAARRGGYSGEPQARTTLVNGLHFGEKSNVTLTRKRKRLRRLLPNIQSLHSTAFKHRLKFQLDYCILHMIQNHTYLVRIFVFKIELPHTIFSSFTCFPFAMRSLTFCHAMFIPFPNISIEFERPSQNVLRVWRSTSCSRKWRALRQSRQIPVAVE